MTTDNPDLYSSVIEHCIIEFGDVSLVSNPNQHGGAIHSTFSELTVSYCEIRFNKAGWGGGIYIKNASPEINNCYVHHNISLSSGGGFFVGTGSSSLILNCIIAFNNSTTSGGGGGIFLGSQCNDVKIINSVISSNSAFSSGKNILFYVNTGLLKPTFTNCIIWNPANSISYKSQKIVSDDFLSCAIQSPPINYTNLITLSADNNEADGPNFTAIDGTDWSISLISPCRDSGTTPSPAVPTDYIGNSRIGPYDIGAYEVQYSRWNGSAGTDWSTGTNWDGGIPDNTRDIIIPAGLSNYPVSDLNPDFTIGSDKQMIIEAGARLTLNDLTNNGTLKLNHDATDFASLILNSYTRGAGGTEEIQLYLSGGGSALEEDYKWHYISSPVSSLSTDIFTGTTLNLSQFVESRPSTSLMQGWVAYDGYVYSTGQTNGPTFSSLTPGKGYDYFHDTDKNYTLSGLLNTSGVIMPLAYSGIPVEMHGFNLLGNPFSSGLNWDDIVDGVYGTYPSNTSKGLYFTRNNDQCSYIAGVGIPSDVTGIIPPMQGFFTKTYSTGNSITLPAEARTHNNIHQRYKGDNIIPLVRLALYEDTESNDETVVRFDEKALAELDNDFDALKMFLSSEKTSIHTRLEDTDFAINGLPYPPEESAVEIPVVVNVISNSMHKISATQLQGLDNYNVILKDKLTGYTADLKATPDLTFSAPPETISDRFVLIVKYITTGYDDPVVRINEFNIYHAYNFINIETIADDWAGKTGSVRVLDMAGKRISESLNVEFNKNSLIQIQSPRGKGLYLVEIGSGKDRYVGKIIIR